MKAESKEAFVTVVTEGLSAPPSYFPINAEINKNGYDSIDAILKNGLKPLSVMEVKTALETDVFVVDTRPAPVFMEGFVPGSVFIGLEGRFAEWAGSLLPFDQPILLITEEGKEHETVVRLARVGFSKVAGYLAGGFDAWKAAGEPIDMIINVEPDELAMDLPFDDKLVVLDVRRPTEFADGHVKHAHNIPLNELTDPATMANLEEDQNIYVHCASGYRSVIAASLLKRQGIHNIRNVIGGWNSIKEERGIEAIKEKSVLN